MRRLLNVAHISLWIVGCTNPSHTDANSKATRAAIPEQQSIPPVQKVCSPVDSTNHKQDIWTYSDVIRDTLMTGDASGFEITLHHTQQRWTGQVREAAGDYGVPKPLANLAVSENTHISFAIPNGSDSSWFDGTINCDSIYGKIRYYRNMLPQHTAYKRIY